VKNKGVANDQFAGIENNLVGVIDYRIERDAPRFVPKALSQCLQAESAL